MLHAASCVCGFVVRDGGDVVAFDMCSGEMGETKPHLSVKNRDLRRSGIRITESFQGRKVTVSEDIIQKYDFYNNTDTTGYIKFYSLFLRLFITDKMNIRFVN